MNILPFLLLFAHFHGNHIWGKTDFPNQSVRITDCSGKLESVYADKRMTMPMVNPFLSDSLGKFSVYASTTCVVVQALEDEHAVQR